MVRDRADGAVRVRKIEFHLGSAWAGKLVYAVVEDGTVEFIGHDGVAIAEHPWPLPGITHAGAKQPHRSGEPSGKP
ncbi:MAG: hypothetical protein LBI84_07570 [Propionibacteriaceae bacterium]|nr:hypothetical protein [Propionibacteriaceae bacterium]